MKKYLILAIFVGLACVLTPVGARAKYARKEDAPNPPGMTETAPGERPDAAGERIAVYMADTGEVREMELREYLIGVVAAEMPAVYEAQALRAQAAVSATLARYMAQRGPREDLQGAVISSDSRRHQGYMPEEEMRRRWEDDFDTYYKKIADAVDDTLRFTVTSEGAPILAAFHAISAGETESAENVWGKAYPYLVRVDSAGDRLSPDYESEVCVDEDAFFALLELEAPEDPENAVADEIYSDAGYLLRVKICAEEFEGSQLRTLFSLRSSAFSIRYASGRFTFQVKGYGHGVGMSQYGADYLARQGYSWQEIVAHYYPGTQISENAE